MKCIGRSYQVRTEIQFTRDEFNYIAETAAQHYDATCKGAFQCGRLGFMYGMNVLHQQEPIISRYFTEDEIQILCKIMEMDHFTHRKPNLELHRSLANILHDHRKQQRLARETLPDNLENVMVPFTFVDSDGNKV